MNLRWIKMGFLICCTTLFLVCGFQSPFSGDIPAPTLAADASSVAFPVSSEVSSSSSSAVSSDVSSQVSSAPASSIVHATEPVAKVALPVVKTQPKVETAAQASQDPERAKVKPKPPAPAPAPASSAASSATSSAASSVASSTASAPASSAASSIASNAASVAASSASLNGWKTENGNLVYYRNGTLLKGWDTLDGTYYGKKYKFNGSTGAVETRLGIDVSRWDGSIDWNAVKADGVDFAIIRIGGRTYGSGEVFEDANFESNYNGAIAAGIKVGVYFFSQAISVPEAQEEASYVLAILHGRRLDEPVAFDTEYQDGARANGLNALDRTNTAVVFCEMIKAGGYTPMVYASKSWMYNDLNMSTLSSYKTWVANYIYSSTGITSYSGNYQYWQYIDCGAINGISTGVDMDVCFS